ncbi:MAG: tetratricopeptide repeat protein, partial [Myxococcota bacterium]
KGAEPAVASAKEPQTTPQTKQPEAETKEPEAAAEEPAPKVTAAEVDTPFEAWNPEAATTSSGTRESRGKAMSHAKEAASLIHKGKFEDARTPLMEALRQDPGYAEGYNMMGVTYYARDQYDDALGWYKKALTANPDFGDAYYNIACIYAVEGKKELALRYLRIAMLNGYAQADAVDKDPDLDKIRGEAEYAEIMKLARGEQEAQAQEAAQPAPTDAPPDAVTDAGPAQPVEPAPAEPAEGPAATDQDAAVTP